MIKKTQRVTARLLFSLFFLLLNAPPAYASFQAVNGVMWFYTTSENIRFTEIRDRLDQLKRDGVRVVGIYSPYHGNPEKWLGCAPFDFYDVSPQSGRMDDFRELVRAAHERGMKVVAYFTNIFLDRNSPFFAEAERQYASGDRASREVSAFHWTRDPSEPLPLPAPAPDSKWAWSETAGAWYWSIWENAGFDFNQEGARREVERGMRFWLGTGLDGFMFDAGIADEKLRHHMVDLVKSHGPGEKWITFESTEGNKAAEYHRFGLTSWFNFEDNDHVNDYARVARGLISVDELEHALQLSDQARALGKNTHAWAKAETEEDEEVDPQDPEAAEERKPYADPERMYAQEAALLAGAGLLYGSPSFAHYSRWSSSLRARWSNVLATVNAHPALLPSASRIRVPALGRGAYAMLRVSGPHKALLVYNFSPSARKVTLRLKGSGVKPGPVHDLFEGAPRKAIQKNGRYQVELPPWGFAILGVR